MTVQTIRRSSTRISVEQLEDRASPSSLEGLISPLLGLGDPPLGLAADSLSGGAGARGATQDAPALLAESNSHAAPLGISNGSQESARPDAGSFSPAGGKLPPVIVVSPMQTELLESVLNGVGGGGTVQGPDESPQITEFWAEQSGPQYHYIFHGVITGDATKLLGEPVYLSNLPTLDGPPQVLAYIVLDGTTLIFTHGITMTSADVGIAEAITQDTAGRWSNTAQCVV